MTVNAAPCEVQLPRTNSFRVLSLGVMDTMVDGRLEHGLDAQRSAAAVRTSQGVAAKHRLAVISSILCQDAAWPTRLDHWKEALSTWRELIDDDLFWITMKDQSRRSGHTAFEAGRLRVAVCRQLSADFSEALLHAIETREFSVVPALARMAMEHRPWLNADAALATVGRQVTLQGFVALRTILQHLSEMALQDEECSIRKALVEREKELRSVAAEFGAMVRSLGELADAEGWEDAVAASKQRLSAAYVDLLDDPHEGVRLIGQARELAHEPQLQQSIKRDWQHMQRAVFCRDAHDLAEQDDFAGAERKLVAALALATEEEKIEIRLMQDRNRQNREAREQDRWQLQRASLCSEAEALVQTGEFARAEYKLSAALAISVDGEKFEVRELLDRCRWARVLRGADPTRNRPFLFTFNGIGARFYGKSQYDLGTDSYVTTHWLTFLFFPVFPLAAYRVTGVEAGPLTIHAKVPQSGLQRTGSWLIAFLVVVLAWWTSLHRARVSSGGRPAVVAAAPRTPAPAIKQETELSALAQSLQERQRKLQLEEADLERQEGYLEKVATSYAVENTPARGQAGFDALVAGYKRRRKEYEKRQADLQAALRFYNDGAKVAGGSGSGPH